MFDRGFKSWCERQAVSIRQEINIAPTDPLDPRQLARHLGIRVWTPHDVRGLSVESRQILLHNDGETKSCWSAVTVVAHQKTVVILNASHSAGRQASDLMHELSHRMLGHEAKAIKSTAEGIMLLSSYEKKQEEEADWLSGCLLLPREALVHIRKQDMQTHTAAHRYGVSVRMLNYRMDMTGVNRQFSRSKARKTASN